MSIYKESIVNLEINGIKIPVSVTIEVDEDYDTIPADDFDFGSEKENKKYLDRFKSGELFIGIITVTAKAFGIKGFDCLGGCHLKTNNMFNSEPFESSVNETIQEYDLMDNALSDLTSKIQKQAKLLKDFIPNE